MKPGIGVFRVLQPTNKQTTNKQHKQQEERKEENRRKEEIDRERYRAPYILWIVR